MARQFSGRRLRDARTAAGLSPERLALKIERSVFSIHSYECGRARPSIEALAAIADTLDVAVDALFDQGVSSGAA